MVMAISIIFLADMQTSTSILQSVGKQMIPVRNLAIGCIFKVIATYILVGVHSVNVMGAAIGTMIAYVIAMFLNAAAVRKYTGTGGSFSVFEKTYIRPMIAAALMAAWAFLAFHVLMKLLAGSGHSEIALSGLCTIIAIMSSMVVYAVLIFLVRVITIEELEQVPIGRKVARIVRKLIR
jgi:stage V sporulation protein B